MSNRGAELVIAYAVIEKRGDKLALFSGEVPIFWMRKVAQKRADTFNDGGPKYVHVERVAIKRLRK